MRTLALLACLLLASPALAQTTKSERDYSNGRLKFIGGLALAGSGALIAATSRTSVEIPLSNVPNLKLSDTSVGRLTFGLAMAGGGVWLALNGRGQMKAARPSTEISFGPRSVQIRRAW